jgi:hypothetical protein
MERQQGIYKTQVSQNTINVLDAELHSEAYKMGKARDEQAKDTNYLIRELRDNNYCEN